MLKNFILVTLRSLRRNSLYSVINISGLSIGIACSILILLWVQNQTSFNKFIPKADRLFQVWVNADFNGTINSWKSVPLPTYEAMKNADANIVNSAVSGWGGNRLLTVGETRVMQRGYFASNEFLDMFEFPMVIGDRSQVLDEPASIVISEKLSELLFKGENPIGELVRLDDASSVKVTGVFKNVPQNSSFQFDYVIPWKHRESIEEWVVNNKTNWGNFSFQVYVELTDAASQSKVEANIKDMLTENGQDDMPHAFFLHPMLRWRLHSNFENGKETGGMHEYVTLFTVIALFIIIIACINFMNLATARSERRAKEVGVRKSLGSSRSQLIFQFYGESLIISFISFILAIFLVQLALPAYNNLVDLRLAIDFTSSEFWLFALGIIFLTGVISGSYPSLYLSSFNPVKTLKGKVNIGKNANTPRKVLVMLQFGFAVILVISTIVIVKQIDLAKNRDLGYNQEGLITIPYTDALAENYNVLKNDLLASGVVESVTRANSDVTSISSNNFIGWPGKPESQRVIFVTVATEYDYAKTIGAEMLYGRDFSKEFASDSGAIVINKAALDLMELEDPIGTQLDLWGSKKTLIGVIDNVLMGSPYDDVKPLFMIMDPEWISTIMVRLSATNDLSGTMNAVQEIFEKHNPAYPFESSFADVDFERKYTEINLTRELSMLFAGLTIFITGLGLFGLASYTAEQRIKEIGIRKVLGASVSNLVTLMSIDFAKLVLIAFVVAAPVAYFLLDSYLQRYPVRTTIDWWIFVVTGVVALLFALVVVMNQARRAAIANPVKSLRSE